MSKVLIIAEVGVNHNGDIKLAKDLIHAAKYCGADIVKFQTFTAKSISTHYAEKAAYQSKNIGNRKSHLEMLNELELSKNDHFDLKDYCKKKNIEFLSSAFDIESVTFLQSLGIERFKIPSGEITNLPYLREISKTKKPVILSTGMSKVSEIKEAISVILGTGYNKDLLTLLHCNTDYPTSMEDVNLRAMNTISEIFGLQVGYSDHTEGIEVPIAAVAMGAKVIEKHLTLDRSLDGPDHKASIEPNQFKQMVDSVRNIELALGSEKKSPSKSEKSNIKIVRKSIVAKKQILKGETFSLENITTKRPGTGISPMFWDKVIGKKAKKFFSEDELIEL